MGLHFGNLGRVYGRVTHTLSPFEVNPLAGWVKVGFLRTCRRFSEEAPYLAQPLIVGVTVWEWAVKANHHTHLKNPADFENDV